MTILYCKKRYTNKIELNWRMACERIVSQFKDNNFSAHFKVAKNLCHPQFIILWKYCEKIRGSQGNSWCVKAKGGHYCWMYIMQRGRHLLILRRNTTEFPRPKVIWDVPKDSGNMFSGQTSRILHAKAEKDYPACYQQKVQKYAFVMVWGVH